MLVHPLHHEPAAPAPAAGMARWRRFVRGLPRDARGPPGAVPAGRGLRLSPRPAAGAACLSGPDRLRMLDPPLQFATGLRVYGVDAPDGRGPTASAWELCCAGALSTMVLSPEASRGFSGEGGVPTDLAGVPAEDAELVAVLLGWEPRPACPPPGRPPR